MRGVHIILVFFGAIYLADSVFATNCPNGCGFAGFCRNNKCLCRPGRKGNPNFACYSPKFYYFCEISSDPMIKTNDDQRAGIKMPASLSLSTLTTRRFARGRGECKIAVSAWSQRFDGKYFVKGIQFKVAQAKKGGRPSICVFRVKGKVVNNQYYWTIVQKRGATWVRVAVFTPTTRRPLTKRIAGCTFRFFKLSTNFLYVGIMCCTTRLAIRPYNPNKPKTIPGVWLMVRKWAKMNSLIEGGLCNNVTNSPQMDVIKNTYGFKSRTQLTTFTGLAYGRPITYLGAYPGLAALQNTLKLCDASKVGAMMTKAEFMFNFAKLIACGKDKMMPITHNVTLGFCKNDVGACSAAIATMKTDCANVKPNKQMKAFLANGCV